MGILHVLLISTWERGNNWHHFLLLVLGKFGLISTWHHGLQSKDFLEGGISPRSSVCPVSSVLCTKELRMCWAKQALWNFPRSVGSPVTLAPLSLSPWEAGGRFIGQCLWGSLQVGGLLVSVFERTWYMAVRKGRKDEGELEAICSNHNILRNPYMGRWTWQDIRNTDMSFLSSVLTRR